MKRMVEQFKFLVNFIFLNKITINRIKLEIK